MPGKSGVRARSAFRQAGDKFQRRRTESGHALIDVGIKQRIASALQLGKILDRLADASLKRFLQGHTDPGNADQRTSGMQGIGKNRIKLRAEADQTRRVGRGQFERARKSRGSHQQASTVHNLGSARRCGPPGRA